MAAIPLVATASGFEGLTTRMRVTIIVNPAAGTAKDRSPVDAAWQQLTGAGHEVHVQETAGKGDAERLSREAVASGAGLVVAAGGDGTLHEVLNGVASADGGLSRCALGVLPIGTGNDFARSMGVEDCDAAVAALVTGATRAVDAIALGARLFLNASAGGFTAETSANVTSDLKQAIGPLAYLIGGARAVLAYEPVAARVETDARTIEADLQLFAVCNGAYIGGGHQLAPTARPDDGLMEVCLVRASSTLDFLALLPRLSSGGHVDDEDVSYFRTREVSMTFARTIPVNTDGEVFDASRCDYRMRAGAVRMVAPQQCG
jgi:diacylglycerol kinase (ATP)